MLYSDSYVVKGDTEEELREWVRKNDLPTECDVDRHVFKSRFRTTRLYGFHYDLPRGELLFLRPGSVSFLDTVTPMVCYSHPEVQCRKTHEM